MTPTGTETTPNMATRSIPTQIKVWNRKLHFYVGLFLVLFIWLFSFSGLLLNHPTWRFAQFWEQRRESEMTQTVQMPSTGDSLATAKDVMRQLGVHGEIRFMESKPSEETFGFRVERPGDFVDIRVDVRTGEATLKRIRFNAWGTMRALHAFTGVSLEDAQHRRDWALTVVWSLCMDVVALGAAFIVLSGVYMWIQLPTKRRVGLVALAIGLISCGFYVFGLKML